MPIQLCTSKGNRGYKFGSTGKCFTEQGARAKAARQGRAIKAKQSRRRDGVPGVTSNRTHIVPSNPLKADPTRTIGLRKRFVSEFLRRFNRLRRNVLDLVVKEDAFGLKIINRNPFSINELIENTRWRFLTDSEKVNEFSKWLEKQIDTEVLATTAGNVENAYYRSFVEEGYRKGAGRAFSDVRKPLLASTQQQLDFFDGTREEFLRQSFAQPIAIDKVKLLTGRVFTDLKGVTDAMATQMTRTLAEGLVQGVNPRVLGRTLAGAEGIVDKIGKHRATVIARTEVIRSHAEGQLDAMERLGVVEVGVMVEWSTAGDDRVCFPAFTYVETINGPVSIQNLKPGMLVYTRFGLKKIIGFHSRKYAGKMVTVSTDRNKVSSTEDHPFWANQEWEAASTLQIGDRVREFVSNKGSQVGNIVHLGFWNTADFPSIGQQVSSFLSIFCRILMPICSVNFKSNFQIGQQKVNTVGTDSSLLNKQNTEAFQNKTNSFLNRCLSLIFSIAGKTAKLLVGIAGAFAEFFVTRITSLVNWGASTFFRTMTKIETSIGVRLFLPKSVTTNTSFPFPLPVRGFTSKGAVIKSVGNRFVDTKFLRASNANLNYLVSPRCFIASSGAELPPLGDCCRASISEFTASGTRNLSSSPIAESIAPVGAKCSFASCVPGKFSLTSVAYKLKRHWLRFLSGLLVFSHRLLATRIIVYDIQVENQPEFFANGFLVHNCPRCQPMEGVVFKIKEARGLIPLHPQCRCSHIPANLGESTKGQTRSKTEIEESIRQSIKAHLPKRTKRTIAEQKLLTPFRDKTIAKKRPKGVLEPRLKPKLIRPQKLAKPRPGVVTKRRTDDKLLNGLGSTSQSVQQISKKLRIPIDDVVDRLLILEERGKVFADRKGWRLLTPVAKPTKITKVVTKKYQFENLGTSKFSKETQEKIGKSLDKAKSIIGKNAPEVTSITTDPILLVQDLLGTLRGNKIILNPNLTLASKRKLFIKEWKGLMVEVPTPENLAMHEYAHIIDRTAFNKNPKKYKKLIQDYTDEVTTIKGPFKTKIGKRFEIDTLDGKTFFASASSEEWVVESFMDVALNGNKASGSAKELVRRLRSVLGTPIKPVAKRTLKKIIKKPLLAGKPPVLKGVSPGDVVKDLNIQKFVTTGAEKQKLADTAEGILKDLVERNPAVARKLRASPITELKVSDARVLKGGAGGRYTTGTVAREIEYSGHASRKVFTARPDIGKSVYTVDESQSGFLRHEIGHHLHISSSDKVQASWRVAIKGSKSKVSKYGAANEFETFAESFSAFTHKGYVRGQLPANIESFMGDFLKATK